MQRLVVDVLHAFTRDASESRKGRHESDRLLPGSAEQRLQLAADVPPQRGIRLLIKTFHTQRASASHHRGDFARGFGGIQVTAFGVHN